MSSAPWPQNVRHTPDFPDQLTSHSCVEKEEEPKQCSVLADDFLHAPMMSSDVVGKCLATGSHLSDELRQTALQLLVILVHGPGVSDSHIACRPLHWRQVWGIVITAMPKISSWSVVCRCGALSHLLRRGYLLPRQNRTHWTAAVALLPAGHGSGGDCASGQALVSLLHQFCEKCSFVLSWID